MFTSPTRCDQFLTFETSQTVLHWLRRKPAICAAWLSVCMVPWWLRRAFEHAALCEAAATIMTTTGAVNGTTRSGYGSSLGHR